ncbi:ABC-2 family transporter protein [Micromonospora sediminicola]|uniref:ABC-2 family transporter protein n=1 Tax=Micromonospora sediminicola TaxID=946078 RepID=A0A1A9BBA4_9ACTN|nr:MULTISPECIES: ABC transporter permease subunit [Micromonospora]PGH44954.1 transmembrane transport protein [Micromonospora sp. WMMA1996]SBT66785.1 ABC-2 family transporter protein [Micromonospora sediminicola]
MIRFTLRQFRLPALAGLLLLALAGAGLLRLGADVRAVPDPARLPDRYAQTMLFLAGGFALVPALLGAFWGAPLVARELEAGTHRLVWNQSVPRTRWLTVKLVVTGLAAALVAGVLSAALTWAAAPVDRVAGDRFSTVLFGARGLAPVGYAVFALVLGAVTGLLLRRTLPAMAVVFLVVVAVQLAVPNLLRPHYLPPERVTVPMTADAVNRARNLGSITGGPVVGGLDVPGAWVTDISPLRTADGRQLSDAAFGACFRDPPRTGATGTFGDTAVCLGALDLHVDLAYQPNRRFWPFQWIELALHLGAAGLLAALGRWQVRRRAG